MVTEARISELRAMLAAIAPYPWQECGHERGGCQCGFVWDATGDGCVARALSLHCDSEMGEGFTEEAQKRHAAFIAAAPGIVEELLDALAETEQVILTYESIDAALIELGHPDIESVYERAWQIAAAATEGTENGD